MGANPFALHFTGEFLMRLKHRAGGDMEEWPADPFALHFTGGSPRP